MKKALYLFLLLVIPVLESKAQGDPESLFKKLFADLKSKNADEYSSHFASISQFEILTRGWQNIKSINQDSLDNALGQTDSVFKYVIGRHLFEKLAKDADSLQLNLAECQYINCKYQVTKDPKILCVSLTASIYIKSGQKYYEWLISEAVLIKGEWRIIGPAFIKKLDDYQFLLNGPEKVSAFGSKVRIKVTLAPPPPNDSPPPPPPPEPPVHH